MATTRLRKTFKYPADSSDSDLSRDELDEEGTFNPRDSKAASLPSRSKQS